MLFALLFSLFSQAADLKQFHANLSRQSYPVTEELTDKYGQVGVQELSSEKEIELENSARNGHFNALANKNYPYINQISKVLAYADPNYELITEKQAKALGLVGQKIGPFAVLLASDVSKFLNEWSLTEQFKFRMDFYTAAKSISDRQLQDISQGIWLWSKKNKIHFPPEPYLSILFLDGFLSGLDPHSRVETAQYLNNYLVSKSQQNTSANAKIEVKSDIEFKKIGPIQYLKISKFSAQVAKELISRLDTAKDIIIDLRDNPGGLIDEAIEIAQFFAPVIGEDPQRDVLLTYLDKDDFRSTVNNLFSPKNLHSALTILVNNKTASSAEALAAILQSRSRALVVGEKTYGKGSVQEVETRFTRFLSIVLTQTLYYIGESQSLQAVSVLPSVTIFKNKQTVAQQKLYENQIPGYLPAPVLPDRNSQISNFMRRKIACAQSLADQVLAEDVNHNYQDLQLLVAVRSFDCL